MKIAIIEENLSRLRDLNNIVSNKWKVDFFQTSQDFGRANLANYDVVVADCSLPTMQGRDLIKSILDKTHAQMLLMSDSSSVFSKEDIENESINGFIDSPQTLMDQLSYLDSKIRISKLMEQESDRINGMLSNGFSLSIKDEVGVLDIKNLPGEATLTRMEKEILAVKVKGIVVCFQSSIINSLHLGVLVLLYKKMKIYKIKMAFWNRSGDSHVEQLMKDCNLDQLYGIFPSMDQAVLNVTSP